MKSVEFDECENNLDRGKNMEEKGDVSYFYIDPNDIPDVSDDENSDYNLDEENIMDKNNIPVVSGDQILNVKHIEDEVIVKELSNLNLEDNVNKDGEKVIKVSSNLISENEDKTPGGNLADGNVIEVSSNLISDNEGETPDDNLTNSLSKLKLDDDLRERGPTPKSCKYSKRRAKNSDKSHETCNKSQFENKTLLFLCGSQMIDNSNPPSTTLSAGDSVSNSDHYASLALHSLNEFFAEDKITHSFTSNYSAIPEEFVTPYSQKTHSLSTYCPIVSFPSSENISASERQNNDSFSDYRVSVSSPDEALSGSVSSPESGYVTSPSSFPSHSGICSPSGQIDEPSSSFLSPAQTDESFQLNSDNTDSWQDFFDFSDEWQVLSSENDVPDVNNNDIESGINFYENHGNVVPNYETSDENFIQKVIEMSDKCQALYNLDFVSDICENKAKKKIINFLKDCDEELMNCQTELNTKDLSILEPLLEKELPDCTPVSPVLSSEASSIPAELKRKERPLSFKLKDEARNQLRKSLCQDKYLIEQEMLFKRIQEDERCKKEATVIYVEQEEKTDKQPRKQTNLHAAVLNCNLERIYNIVEIHKKYKKPLSDINIRDGNEKTALDYAIEKNMCLVADYLRENTAVQSLNIKEVEK